MADPISENEIAARTRRYEDTRTDVETIKHDVLALRTELSGFKKEVSERIDALSGKLDAFVTEQRSVNATLVGLLTDLVGRKPEAE
jgi:hypothetical protein